MKKNKMIVLAIILGFNLFFYGTSLGDGGGVEPPQGSNCNKDPIPKPEISSPLIQGYFTAAYDNSQAVLDDPIYRHYNIQVVLEMPQLINGKEKIIRHLFSYQKKYSKPICSYTARDLIERYKILPCVLEVGKAFNLEGFPVLTKLKIIKKDFCGNNDVKDDMVYGIVKIRVVE